MLPAPDPGTRGEALGPEMELVEGFYNLRAGFNSYTTGNWYLTREGARSKDRAVVRKEALRELHRGVTSAIVTIQKQRRKLDRVEAHLESLLPDEWKL